MQQQSGTAFFDYFSSLLWLALSLPLRMRSVLWKCFQLFFAIPFSVSFSFFTIEDLNSKSCWTAARRENCACSAFLLKKEKKKKKLGCVRRRRRKCWIHKACPTTVRCFFFEKKRSLVMEKYFSDFSFSPFVCLYVCEWRAIYNTVERKSSGNLWRNLMTQLALFSQLLLKLKTKRKKRILRSLLSILIFVEN